MIIEENIVPYFKIEAQFIEKDNESYVSIKLYEAQIHKIVRGEYPGKYKIRQGIKEIIIYLGNEPRDLEQFVHDYLNLMLKYNLKVNAKLIKSKHGSQQDTYWDEITGELSYEQAIQKLNELFKFTTIISANNYPQSQYKYIVNNLEIDKTKMLLTNLPKWKKWFGQVEKLL